MFYLIPAPLHRAGLRLAHAVRLRWWRLTGVRLNGCRILAFDDAGRILLIRHSYGSGNWMLPGGGIGRGENPVDAARRELIEETGSGLRDARLCTVIEEQFHGTINRVHLVTGGLQGHPQPDGREIVELGLFQPDALPEPLSPALAREMDNWLRLCGQSSSLP